MQVYGDWSEADRRIQNARQQLGQIEGSLRNWGVNLSSSPGSSAAIPEAVKKVAGDCVDLSNLAGAVRDEFEPLRRRLRAEKQAHARLRRGLRWRRFWLGVHRLGLIAFFGAVDTLHLGMMAVLRKLGQFRKQEPEEGANPSGRKH
jgi:hypothetical protein